MHKSIVFILTLLIVSITGVSFFNIKHKTESVQILEDLNTNLNRCINKSYPFTEKCKHYEEAINIIIASKYK